MNKLYRKCNYCNKTGVAKEEVFWVLDPYLSDVENMALKRWLHKVCEDELTRDV